MDLALRGAAADLLTRTSLRFGSDPSPPAIEQVVRALRRVPGVLTVETDAGASNALVAHDAAVPTASLLAAAKLAGVEVKVVPDVCARLAPAAPGTVAQPLNQRHLRSVAIAAILGVIIIDMTFPHSPDKRWVYLIPLAMVWAIIVVGSLAARRQ